MRLHNFVVLQSCMEFAEELQLESWIVKDEDRVVKIAWLQCIDLPSMDGTWVYVGIKFPKMWVHIMILYFVLPIHSSR